MKRFVFISLLFFVAVLLNYWARKKLPFAYADIADYSLLYTTDEDLYVKKIGIYRDSVEMYFNGLPTGKPVFTLLKNRLDTAANAQSDVVVYEGNPLRYKPAAGKPQVRASLNKRDSFLLNVTYTSAETYARYDNRRTGVFELTSPDVLIEPARVRSIADWAASAWFSDERMSLQRIRQFLNDSILINDYDSSISKIIKIAQYILKRTKNKGGIPADYLSTLHPLQQLQEIQSGRTGLWCGNYVAIFSCLATVAGIPVRTIGTDGEKGGVAMGVHMLCEAYIHERKSWAYVDLLANAFLIMNNNRYLNAIDVQRLLPYRLPDTAISAYSFRNDSVVVVPFNEVRAVPDYYFTPNTLFTFYYDRYFSMYPANNYFKRLKNFFSTNTYYALYSDNIGNIKRYEFYTRLISNILLVVVSIILIGYVVVKASQLVKPK